jgi:hypothetical protein
MKGFLMVAITLIASVISYGQQTSFTVDSFYQKKSEHVIHSQVLEFPNKTKTEIMNGFKNWASTRFVNLKEVTVSETEDQIVLNYITKDFYTKTLGMTNTVGWYIRVVVEFKEGKMRINYTDDGNAFISPTQYSVATPARTYKFEDYFKEDGQVRKGVQNGLQNVKHNIVESTQSIKLVEQKKNNDNW